MRKKEVRTSWGLPNDTWAKALLSSREEIWKRSNEKSRNGWDKSSSIKFFHEIDPKLLCGKFGHSHNFYYFCDSRNNIEIWKMWLSFLSRLLFMIRVSTEKFRYFVLQEFLHCCFFGVFQISKKWKLRSISVRFKFFKLPTTIRFACDEMSEW